MSKIRVLSEHLSNRIAAGEVIERPASVVKELVENAIDAGATHITVAIERAGTRLISVSDNGSGMDPDDAMMALEPHGTSKIHEESDIDHIITLGFRGEAVPSIASISRFSLTTRMTDSVEGTEVVCEGGVMKHAGPVGCAPGTTIRVRDLFFNTPARKKFLKSDATEEHHIEEMLIALALPYPEITFELYLDGRRAIQSPGAPDLTPRLREFFGRNFADQMLPVDHQENGLAISGYVAAPGFTRTSRREQRTFVNGRAVESLAIYRGIRDGYATLADTGRFPPCVLFLQLDPAAVDVNVHPAKREVRFKQEFIITRAFGNAIGGALKQRETPRAALDYHVPMEPFLESAEIQYAPAAEEQPELMPPKAVYIPPAAPSVEQEPELKQEWEPEPEPVYHANPSPVQSFDMERLAVPEEPKVQPPTELPEMPPTELPEMPPTRPLPNAMVFNGEWPTEVIGVLDKTYIIASGNRGLVLIDQHAAHERILFEQLQRDAAAGVPAQHLLLPLTVELPRNAVNLLLRSRELFAKLGFDIESMGGNTVMLNALPASLPSGDLATMLQDMLDELVENSAAKLPLEQEFVARAACKAAIKAHDYLTPELAKHLLEQLGKCKQGTLCPHGRPTMLTITLGEIERRFGRK